MQVLFNILKHPKRLKHAQGAKWPSENVFVWLLASVQPNASCFTRVQIYVACAKQKNKTTPLGFRHVTFTSKYLHKKQHVQDIVE